VENSVDVLKETQFAVMMFLLRRKSLVDVPLVATAA
jgi:hypothetical protein